MKRKIIPLVLALALLACTVYAALNAEQLVTASGDIYIFPNDFPPGQTLDQAIQNETIKDWATIIVMANQQSHIEHLSINKSLTLWGGLGGDTYLNGGGSGTVVSILASNVTFKNFIVENGQNGILILSGNNSLTDNIIRANSNYGIWIGYRGPKNTLRNNDIYSNGFNLGVEGGSIQDFVQYIDTSNYINGKPIIYLVGAANRVISNAGYVAVVNSRNITVANLSMSYNGQGVLVVNSTNISVKNLSLAHIVQGVVFAYTNVSAIKNVICQNSMVSISLQQSNNNIIQNNTIVTGNIGLLLSSSGNNKVITNNISNMTAPGGNALYSESSNNNTIIANSISNSYCGITLRYSNGSTFYRNSIINNEYQNSIYNSLMNKWDNGYEGNYWSNYTGTDSNLDGIGNTNLPCNEADYRPLMQPWRVIKEFYAVKRNISSKLISNVAEWPIITVSNSTRAGFCFSWSKGEVSFNVTSGTPESINITICRDLLDGPFNLTLNNAPFYNYVFRANANYSSFYFIFIPGVYHVKIAGKEVGTIPGDVNRDKKVNVLDLIYLVSRLDYQQWPE